MSHPRTQIRDYVVTKLKGATAADQNVSGERAHPHPSSTTAAIRVRTPNDRVVGKQSQSPLTLKRSLTLEVVIAAKGDAAEDSANTIAESVEALLLSDLTLGGLVDECLLEDTAIDIEAADKKTAEAIVTFSVTYYTEHGAQAEADADFTLAQVQWDLGPDPDGQIEAEDAVNPQGE